MQAFQQIRKLELVQKSTLLKPTSRLITDRLLGVPHRRVAERPNRGGNSHLLRGAALSAPRTKPATQDYKATTGPRLTTRGHPAAPALGAKASVVVNRGRSIPRVGLDQHTAGITVTSHHSTTLSLYLPPRTTTGSLRPLMRSSLNTIHTGHTLLHLMAKGILGTMSRSTRGLTFLEPASRPSWLIYSD